MALSSHLKYSGFVADLFFFLKEAYNRKMFPLPEDIPAKPSVCLLLPSLPGHRPAAAENRTHGPASTVDTSHVDPGTAVGPAGAGGRPSWPQSEALMMRGAAGRVPRARNPASSGRVVQAGCRPWPVLGPSELLDLPCLMGAAVVLILARIQQVSSFLGLWGYPLPGSAPLMGRSPVPEDHKGQ